jgi:hypothetical protein
LIRFLIFVGGGDSQVLRSSSSRNVALGDHGLMRFSASVARLPEAWRWLPSEFRRQVVARFEELDHGSED